MIKTISLINCQSWDNSTIELATDRVNVLEAENNVGKSVLFKMLRITADPKAYSAAERRQLIRWETNGAIALFCFDDGTQGYTQVMPNGVSYYYNGHMYAAPPAEYLEKIGLLTSNGMIANFITGAQSLLLVDPTLRANYDLMQLLVHDENLENVRDHTEANIKSYNIKSDMLNMVAGVIENQLRQFQYTDIEKKKKNYEIGSVCYELIYDVIIPVQKQIAEMENVSAALNFEDLQIAYGVLEELSALNFASLERQKFDPELLQMFHVLDAVSDARFGELAVCEYDTRCEVLYDVLTKVSGISFEQLYVEEQADLRQPLEVLQKLSSLDVYEVYVDPDLQKTIKELQAQLQDAEAFYECPIYGQIMYDGDYCRPYSLEE